MYEPDAHPSIANAALESGVGNQKWRSGQHISTQQQPLLDWPSSKEAHPIHYSIAVWKDDIEGQILFQTLMRAKLNTEDYPPHAAASFVCQYVRAYLDRQLRAGSVFVFVCSIDFLSFLTQQMSEY